MLLTMLELNKLFHLYLKRGLVSIAVRRFKKGTMRSGLPVLSSAVEMMGWVELRCDEGGNGGVEGRNEVEWKKEIV